MSIITTHEQEGKQREKIRKEKRNNKRKYKRRNRTREKKIEKGDNIFFFIEVDEADEYRKQIKHLSLYKLVFLPNSKTKLEISKL